jgi:predicted ATP-binding protein involved in virulence
MSDDLEHKVIGYQKIMSHPDKNEIIMRMSTGDTTRKVEGWLKNKYAKNKALQLSFVSLQSFRKNYLNLYGDTLKQIQEERKKLQVVKRREQEQENVQKVEAYQVGLANYVQESIIDYNREILGLIEECKEGVRSLKDINAAKSSHLNHQAIAAYIGRLQDVIQMHAKMLSDQEKKQGNRLQEDYVQLNKKMEILIDAVKEAFTQTNPEGLTLFVEIVRDKMTQAGLVN